MTLLDLRTIPADSDSFLERPRSFSPLDVSKGTPPEDKTPISSLKPKSEFSEVPRKSSLSNLPVKGARDFYPAEMRLQKHIFETWRSVCESYGYEEYDAPILEHTDLYLAKGNQEIIDEQTYTFTDRGGRSLTVRTEMTPTISRMIAARRQEMAYPARLFSIPQCWRYERMQRGRGREFYQLNVDVFGIDDDRADLEAIQISDAILQAFGAKRSMYQIKIGSRKLTNSILGDYLGLNETQVALMIKLIDRMHKTVYSVFSAQVEALCTPSQRETGIPQKLLDILSVKSIDGLPDEIQQHESVKSLQSIGKSLVASGVTNHIYDPTLMRGFDYYTDVVFEVFDTHPDNNRSMFGGGRYDGLVAQFGVEPVSTVGFGMGDITLQNFLEAHELLPKLRTATDVYVVGIGETDTSVVANELRTMGLNIAVDGHRDVGKQFKAATKLGIRYALVVGEQEIADQQYKLKDLTTGEEQTLSAQRVVTTIKDHRKK